VSVYRAEYIWIDGTEPTKKLRSKTKIVPSGEEPPIWGFDGSSTQQATGDRSDCVLQPVFVCSDPIRGGDDKLVLCEVMLVLPLARCLPACLSRPQDFIEFAFQLRFSLQAMVHLEKV